MSNSNRFLLFQFKPHKLHKERILVEKEFKDSENKILRKRSRFNLPKLLEEIRKVDFTKLYDFMKTLKKMDILILIYEYPYKEETNETRKKINKILGEMYISTVGRTAWELFQQDVEDPFLKELIKLSYRKDQDKFLGIDRDHLQIIGKAFEAKEGIIFGLATHLLRSTSNSKQVLGKWKIKEGSILEKKLITFMLLKGLNEDFIIQRDGVETVIQFFNQSTSNDYKSLLKVYLEARDYKVYNYKILEQAIRRLFDPRENSEEWNFLSQYGLEQVKRWMYTNELKEFFDSDTNSARFDYWKRFIDYMENVIPLKSPVVAFIYFDDFIVVEFGEIGSAYFYHRNVRVK
ncbi:hypothetical protein MXL46_07720 [Heyndrickxia sporothermodurans]|uniref:hypothetical protein n=1 Tax=Heyndrickxia sporothermodurans TaxID=46224 RepID=UPI002DB5ABC9|nr:hypothetical protein [Heyndrickxia sporothermodurans]MEB6548983.1 hypothetical protein [Heyndrickxia sporothermodurans]